MKARYAMMHKLTLLALASALALAGCSDDVSGPATDGHGKIVLRFENGSALSSGYDEPASTMQLVDSVAVLVFRPFGTTPEVSGGARVPGLTGVEIEVDCIAESNKKVSVELFNGATMTHQGVNEQVDVTADAITPVTVEAYWFALPPITVSPSTVIENIPFTVSWRRVPAATFYTIQESTTPDFADVVYQASLTDTAATYTRGLGAHYFRVVPQNSYSTGTFTHGEWAYVYRNGSGPAPVITGMDTREAAPGEKVTLTGENLDYPGARVDIGGVFCETMASAWDYVTVRVPFAARTDYLRVQSDPGTGVSPNPLVVDRIAYVTQTGQFGAHYAEYLLYYPADTEYSGVAFVPVQDLDWRDMSVFDVIVVAHDTGTNQFDWGGGVPARANAIAASESNVLAVGLGGAVYLSLASAAAVPASASQEQFYYVPDGTPEVFNTPYWVSGSNPSDVWFCTVPEPNVTIDIDSNSLPPGFDLYAQVNQGVERWLLAEYLVAGTQRNVRHFFWGFAGDPYSLTGLGADCLSNVIFRLYNDASAVTPAAASVPGPAASATAARRTRR